MQNILFKKIILMATSAYNKHAKLWFFNASNFYACAACNWQWQARLKCVWVYRVAPHINLHIYIYISVQRIPNNPTNKQIKANELGNYVCVVMCFASSVDGKDLISRQTKPQKYTQIYMYFVEVKEIEV